MVRTAFARTVRGVWGRPTVLLYVLVYLGWSAVLSGIGTLASGLLASFLSTVILPLLRLLGVAPVLVACANALDGRRLSPNAVVDRVSARLVPLIPAGGLMFVCWLVFVIPAVILFGIASLLLGIFPTNRALDDPRIGALLVALLAGTRSIEVVLVELGKQLLLMALFLPPAIAVMFVPAAVVLRDFTGMDAVYESLRVVRTNPIETVGVFVVVALLSDAPLTVMTLGEHLVPMGTELPAVGNETVRVLFRTPFLAMAFLFYVAYYLELAVDSS